MHVKPFDLSAPGAVEALLEFHRGLYGAAVMMAGDAPDEGDAPQDSEAHPNDAGGEDDSDLHEGGKRALEAERRARRDAARAAKEAKERADALAARLAEIERAQMSDQDRLAAERDDLRKKYEETQAALAARDLELVRREVAEEKGIPARMARRLQGSTREQIEADADVFLKDMPEPPREKYVDRTAGLSSHGARTSMADDIAQYIAERKKRSGGLGV